YLHALHHDSVAAGWLSGTVVLPRFTRLGISLESQPIEAGLEGRIDTLGYAAEYFPGMDSLAGSVALDAQLAGMAAAPSFEVRVDFDSLFVWLPRGRAGQGSVALHAQGNMNPDRSLAGTLEVMPRGVIYDYTLDELPRRVFVDSGGLTGATGSDGTSATFALGVSDSADNRILTLAADLALPGYTALGRPVAAEPFEARLEAEVPSFAFVRAATDRYDSLAGSISLSASAGGRIATPNLEAELRIDSLYARSITGTETRASLLGTLSAAVADDSTLSGLLRLTPDNVRFAYV